MSQFSVSNSLITIFLVIIESILTLILRFDAKLRQSAYPLVQSHTLICVRSYLPHKEIYVSFTAKGILLDNGIPADHDAPDVIINAYSSQMFSALLSNKEKTINTLQMQGKDTDVASVKKFLSQLSINSVIESVFHMFKAQPPFKQPNNDDANPAEAYRIQVSELQDNVLQLTITNRQLETQVAELKSQQKFLRFTLVVLFITMLVCVFGWVSAT